MKNNQHLRELDSIPFHEQNPPDEFREFAEIAILPSISITGYKRQAKREQAINMVHDLVTTGLMNKVVADSRDWHTPGAKLRTKLWDTIIGAGFASFCKGSELSGKRSRYQASGRLLSLQHQWDLQMLQSPIPKDLVYMHTGKVDMATGDQLPPENKKQPIPIIDHVTNRAQPGPNGKPDPQAIMNGMSYWREMERAINTINGENFNHSWKAHSPVKNVFFQPSVGLRQIHVGEAFNGARFYTWGWMSAQSIPKKYRQTIEIDREPTTELDYGGMMTRMLYHSAQIDIQGDVYQPDRVFPKYYRHSNASRMRKAVLRDFVKKVTTIAINSKSRQKANGSLIKLVKEHRRKNFLWTVFKHEQTDPSKLLDRVESIHEPIANRFYTNIGLEMQTLDGKIMFAILRELTNCGIPCLGIHDSVLGKRSDASTVREVMENTYKKFLGFQPVIQ